MSKPVRTALLGVAMLLVGVLTGCTLGEGIPSAEGGQLTPIMTEVSPLSGPDLGAGTTTPGPSFATLPPSPMPAPTITPTLGEGAEAAFGPIVVESANFRTLETVTARLNRGSAVSNVTCTYTIHETATNVVLDPPTSRQVNATTYEDVFTFTPTQAGTYQVSCTGLATTSGGLRTVGVSEAGTPFAIEAKG